MACRKQPIFPDQIYHVFNRGIAKIPIFQNKRNYERFQNTANFYRFSSPGLRFSHYDNLETDKKLGFLSKLKTGNNLLVQIYAYCLMPTHFHFIIKEIIKDGLKTFAGNLQNSYAKYFNTKTDRTGSLFQEMFKAVRIESNDQLLHTVRYVHLNPFTSYLIKEFDDLFQYPWSSLRDYSTGMNLTPFVDSTNVNKFYRSKEEFISFTKDQADYQRKLEEMMHLTLDFD